jgi:hypothetical protein
MAVTVYQDGPDLANQGTIVVSQPVVQPRQYNFSALSGPQLVAWAPIDSYSQEDFPAFDTSQSMPSAYFGRSREGAYVPLKLGETCQKWVSEADCVGISNLTPAFMSNNLRTIPGNSNVPSFPHVNIYRSYYNENTLTVGGGITSPMLNPSWAHVCARNLAVTTSYTFFVRCGIEMQVHPSSNLAPQQRLSPKHDPVALAAYFTIARELKDAYPADYNDLGRMWEVISGTVRKVLPFLKLIPGAGNIISTGAKGVLAAGDAIQVARQKRALKGFKKQRKRQKKQRKQKPEVAPIVFYKPTTGRKPKK